MAYSIYLENFTLSKTNQIHIGKCAITNMMWWLWMRNITYSLVCLNNWSTISGTVWGGLSGMAS